jgi:Ca2+-binding RTX toxin-like protein
MLTRMAVVLAASFILPTAAQAASKVSNDGTTTFFRSGLEPADVRIDTTFGPPFGIQSLLTDLRGDMVVGAGCTAGAPVVCPGDRLDIGLNGGDDRVVSFGQAYQSLSGGAGNDVMLANSQSTTLSGGGGDDVVKVNSNNGTVAHGDGGNDVIWGYENFPTLYGDGGNDFLFGAGQPNHLLGGSGDDRLIGSAGPFRGGTLEGGGGADIIAFLAAGGHDPWTADGGDGPDTIVGSPGTDTITGGWGADRIDVTADGNADSVTCGGGVDRVYADPEDVVAGDCELRSAAPMPADPAVAAALDRAAHLGEELQPLFDDPRM